MKRARFQPGMTPDDDDDDDDDSEHLRRRRRPDAPSGTNASHQPPSGGAPPGFLTLPTELKQQIYSYLLDADRVAPPSAPYRGEHDTGTGEVRYPRRYQSWRWPPAHWACKTFRNDLIDLAQERLVKRQVGAELDIMVNGFVFFPTWLYLPPDLPGDGGFDLDVSLRLFSGEAFRSNDGWPRQPGSGFRVLLRLLSQLVHEGPSFGQHFEMLAGHAKWVVNTLRVNLTFHDPYTPSTHPHTTREVFRMLKSLATSGLAHGILKTIHAHAAYRDPATGHTTTTDRIYPVSPPRPQDSPAQQWRQMGFLSANQRTLADDYRPSWDPSSGGPRHRAPKLVPSLERRDSPVGVVLPAGGKGLLPGDLGLITPPTPRAVEGAPAAPKPSSSGSGATHASAAYDDYSLVMTPNMGYDDYSIVMTPVPSGPVEEEGYY